MKTTENDRGVDNTSIVEVSSESRNEKAIRALRLGGRVHIGETDLVFDRHRYPPYLAR
jgi:hypothetical protein